MHNITLIYGDGIGKEVIASAKEIIDYSGADINWDIVEAGYSAQERYGTPLPDHVTDSIKKNRIALNGPVTTPIGKGFRSVNVALRKQLNLFANVRPIGFKGLF